MMSDKEKKLRIMDVANDIAHHATDAIYVKTRAEDLVADLFCDCIRDGAKAYLCVTGAGPAYTIDTDLGSFTVPFASVNEKLMNGVASITGNANLGLVGPSEDEKKKNIIEDPIVTASKTTVFDDVRITETPKDVRSFAENGSCEHSSQEHVLLKNNKDESNNAVSSESNKERAQIQYVGVEGCINELQDDANANSVRTMMRSDNVKENIDDAEAADLVSDENVNFEAQPIVSVSASCSETAANDDTTDIENSLVNASAADSTPSVDDIAESLEAFSDESETNDVEYGSYEEAHAIQEVNDEIHSSKKKEDADVVDESAIFDDIPVSNPNEDKTPSEEEFTGKMNQSTEEKNTGFHHGFRSQITISEDVPVKRTGKYSAIDQNIVTEEPKVFAYANDYGQIFKHTHNISVTLKYGSNTGVTKYKVEFWPTWVQFGSRSNTYAECLVRISDETGHEKIDMIDRNNKELTYQFPGTEHKFKMVGAWQSGMLSTVVQLVNDAKYTIKTTVQKDEPEVIDGNYLNQFKVEAKGQPKYFIVPLRADNRGEERIPIIGIVEEPGHSKFILSRMPNNTCQHTFNNRTRIISGHWENGLFHISIS